MTQLIRNVGTTSIFNINEPSTNTTSLLATLLFHGIQLAELNLMVFRYINTESNILPYTSMDMRGRL